jgi:hypothetical protein
VRRIIIRDYCKCTNYYIPILFAFERVYILYIMSGFGRFVFHKRPYVRYNSYGTNVPVLKCRFQVYPNYNDDKAMGLSINVS